MNEKLKLLLEQICMSEQSYFEGGSLEKIIVYENNSLWEFVLNISKTLPINIYQELINGLEKQFNGGKIDLLLQVDFVDYAMLKDYYEKCFQQFIKNNVMLEVFLTREITFSNNKIIVPTYNKAEYMAIKKIQTGIKSKLIRMGFSDCQIEIIVDEKGDELTKQQIASEIEIKDMPVKTINKEIKIEEKGYKNYRAKKSETITNIEDITYEVENINIEGLVFGSELFETKNGFKIVTLKVTNEVDSIYVKLFIREDDEYNYVKENITVGNWYRFYGRVVNDNYAHELVFNTRVKDIVKLDKEVIKHVDVAEEKRIELHAHTFMSQMDGVVPVKKLIKRAIEYGHEAIAITDHNCAQSFPEAYKMSKDIKVLFGCELSLIDDEIDICFRENDQTLLDSTYVVFDLETTGLNAGGVDSIIEIGAVRIKNGEIIDRYSKLINPKVKLPAKIVEITNITDAMLEDCEDEETVVKEFKSWLQDDTMVAHNAKFDSSFMAMAYQKYNLGSFNNTVIDTLELSRVMNPTLNRHTLSALVKKYDVPFDENAHHRADYDAEGTAYVFNKMLHELDNRNINKISDLNKMVDKDKIHTLGNAYHFTMLARTQTGLKNMYRIISLANTKYYYKSPRILRSKLTELRDGILIGSSCANGEVFDVARTKSDEELAHTISFYDYVEIQPPEVYDHLIQSGNFNSRADLLTHLKKIIRVAEESGITTVATGDVHHLDREDKISREIIVNQKVPGGGKHPLNKKGIKSIPSQHLRTTKEMLEDFNFLDSTKAKELVIDNPKKISDMIEKVVVIIDTGGMPFAPKMENSDKIVKDMVYDKAHSIYGEKLPELIENRLKRELDGIIGGGFDVIYLIAQKLVKKSNDDGYFVGSRGSVGSSFVATMMGISEVNPLPAHYVCPKCKTTLFEVDGKVLSKEYSSGYDLPDKQCSCGTMFFKDGQDMPFETFLGFKADKVPDIDLNFSSEYQARAHEYTKVLFGSDYVFRAGTVGTVAEKTAYGFVLGYFEDRMITNKRRVEIERLALGCTGVKRTTGQHPGGIVVVPNYKDIFDFTPFQNPADDVNSPWHTTQFDYHSMEEELLKLDILAHDDPTMLKVLSDLSGMKVEEIPLDDRDVFSLLCSPKALGVTSEDIMCSTGSLGLPEIGTRFSIKMLEETKPQTFGELVKIAGLSHGTDVWNNNAQELIRNKTCAFKEVIGCRDDIMVYLMNEGLEPIDAFKIMEFVRKGKPKKDPETWKTWAKKMEEKNIKSWYIESCRRIQYMFPKAHATAYSIMCCRVAWFKVHQPINFYSAYFSVRCFDFDIEVMIKGYNSIKAKILELSDKGFDKTNKESNVLDVLCVALEMTARGFKFANLDIYCSHYKNFIIDEDKKTLIPPFRSLDGLGEVVAKSIYEEAQKGKFISIEDFNKRCKVSTTLIDKMRLMNMFGELPETSQLSLF